MNYAARLLPLPLHDAQFVVALALGPAIWLTVATLFGQQWQPTAPPVDPLRLASLVVAWPLIEEWLFRGHVQPWLARRAWGARAVWGITVANVATSALFAAAHLLAHAPAWALATFAPSLVFGYFRDRHNSIVPGVALHVFYNAGWFLLVGV
jgi:membrane protease YdiL (CAAX protease family)